MYLRKKLHIQPLKSFEHRINVRVFKADVKVLHYLPPQNDSDDYINIGKY